jgi:hypothetical protein
MLKSGAAVNLTKVSPSIPQKKKRQSHISPSDINNFVIINITTQFSQSLFHM